MNRLHPAGELASETRGAEPDGRILAVCVSSGGIPKTRVHEAMANVSGLAGDWHEHEKHNRPHRALLLQDVERLEELAREGFTLAPGSMGENLTIRGLNVQNLAPGTRLRLKDGPVLELTEPRRPCYVLDQIDPRLQKVVVGRCGYLARVVSTGRVFEGQHIYISDPANADR